MSPPLTALPRPSVLTTRMPPTRTDMDLPVVFDARVVTGSGGGPDKTILNSPRFLTALGYRMVCGYLTPPGDPGYAEIVRKAGKYAAPLTTIHDRGPWDWRIVRRLLAVCRSENVRIWHGHDYKTNMLGLLLKRFHSMRLVSTAHGWVRHTARTPLYYRLDRFCLPRYERVYCVSDDLVAECREAGVRADRCELLENAIDAVEYTRRQTAPEAKRALGLPATGLLIGGVGRLSPEKGFDLLLRSVADLVGRGRDVRLVLVGDGDDRPRLEGIAGELGIADRVRFAGWCGDVRPYFEAMDIFALSSLREGLPNVLLEAMALGVPVVATRIAGIPRMIHDGRNGTLVEPGDGDALTGAVDEQVRNPGLRAAFATAGRETVSARYSFPARMTRLARSYDELLATHPTH